jgi:Trk K+ transport system NAD-binding subunit
VAHARGVLILTSDDLINISAALTVRSIDPAVRVVLRMFNQNLIPRLGKAVHNIYALSTSVLTAPLFALSALTGQSLGTFRIDEGIEGRRQVAEVLVSGAPLLGRTLAEMTARYRVVVLAHLPAGSTGRFLLEVQAERRLTAGDRLIVCGKPHDLEALLARGGEVEQVVRWAGWLRRHGRALWRTLSEIDLPVKICAGVLITVIVVSTLVLRLGVEKYRTAVAFLRTISLLATGADMHEQDYDADWLRVFASGLRIMGAVLIASFTAIFTNYLLRARLGGALEIRRIPDGGHVIVCGLGNIGYRVVEELLSLGERVVVIEVARDNRFVPTTRRLGVPVIIGDATMREVLRQAHSPSSRAVIAATNHDLINLEVALLVRDLTPEQSVVVRLADPYLAATLRENANVQLALSVATLAAPAFVAGLFGDRVLSVCLVAGRLLAVVTLAIGPQDTSLVGACVPEVASRYRLVPVAVISGEGLFHPQPFEARLEPGDHLVGFIALSDMDRLLVKK